jgi:hypothetical protein
MKRVKGQILPLILFAIAIGGVMLVIMFNVTQKVTDKTISSNAADAAAYSGGVWAARQLNYMAYTNRAMVANHVAAGHMIAYVSWTRYVESTTSNINQIARFIPYLNAVVAALEEYSTVVREAAEYTAEIMIPAIDTVNLLYATSQYQAQLDLNPTQVESIMRTVVEAHDPILRFNNTSDLNGSSGNSYKPVIDAAITVYRAKLLGAVEILSPGEDDNEMSNLVELSYAGSTRWLNNRKWHETLVPGLYELKKEGSTHHELDTDLGYWKADDALKFGQWTPKGWSWSTIGWGRADTDEFYEDYQGIHSYARKRSDPDEELYIDLVTLATKFDNETVPRTVMDIDSKGTVISGYSKARLYFEKPAAGFANDTPQYSNFYNPFWKVKLVEPWL